MLRIPPRPIYLHWSPPSPADDFSSKYFQGDKLYGLTIGGGTTVVIRNTADIAAVWKNTTALSYDPFTSRLLTAFGISPANVEKAYKHDPASLIRDDITREKSLLYNANPKKKSYIDLQSDWFKTQLLPGERLNHLQETYLTYLQQLLKFERFDDHFAVHSSGDGMTVALGKFCRYIVSRSAFRAFFGEELFEAEPDLIRLYQTWEDVSWKMFYNFPHFLAPELHEARRRVVAGLAKYYEMPESKRKNTIWLFRVIDQELKALDFSKEDRVGLVMLVCWATNINAPHIAFWMFSHMLCNPTLLEAVKKETDACCTDDGSCDLDKLLTSCPHLQAVWYEVLRLYNASTAVRTAVQDCTIGGKIIHKGNQIFGPVRNFQLNSQFFGANPTEFNAYRFIENPTMVRSKGYFPFGGGHTYCPGRFFAEREIYMFVGLTLRRFEIQVSTPEGVAIENPQVPPININMPAPAALHPTRDLYVTFRKRVL
ncbi:hypothetical protein VTN77DRAFT_4732 [Rasamsonia byssochlamydoides]|uniref:uncharacterized protein n=1 Tax=Rasamsonia byssochlamydoides TaxID=89139 RepID=UPI003744561D